jgi:hypothetical protein
LVHTANQAFVEAFRWGSRVGAVALVIGVLIVLKWLPARADAVDEVPAAGVPPESPAEIEMAPEGVVV